MDEVRVCQLLALLEREAAAAAPKPRLSVVKPARNKAREKEARLCQLRALLNEMWGPAPAQKPNLVLIRGGRAA